MDPVLVPAWPDAARSLGVGRSTIWELMQSGQLVSVRIGRRRLVPVAAIRAYAEQLEAEHHAAVVVGA